MTTALQAWTRTIHPALLPTFHATAPIPDAPAWTRLASFVSLANLEAEAFGSAPRIRAIAVPTSAELAADLSCVPAEVREALLAAVALIGSHSRTLVHTEWADAARTSLLDAIPHWTPLTPSETTDFERHRVAP